MEDDQTIVDKKISVAVMIRKIIYDLNCQLSEFINSNSLETKQRFGTYIVNTHKKIKMLLKFLNVIKNSKKLEEIQKLTELVIRDKSVFYDMSADFFIKVSNLRLQKTPEFDLRKAVSILCYNRFDIMPKNILSFIVNNSIDYYTIRKNDIKEIFEFEQKFLEGVRDCCIERYKTNIKLNLKSQVFLHKLQDKINKESLVEHDYYYSFEIGSFFVFNFLFLPKDNEYFTYQVSEIKINPKETVFKINEDQIVGFINTINFELLNKNLPLKETKSSKDNDNLKDPCIQISEVLQVFKVNLKKYIMPIFFKKLQEFLEKNLVKMYKKISSVNIENEDIAINFKFEQKLENYFIKLSYFSENNKIFVRLLYSHKVIKEDTEIIFIKNFKEVIHFNELNETAFDIKIYEAINDFYKIQNYIILSKLRLFQSEKFDIHFEFSSNKICCFLRRNNLFFSVIIDNKGEFNLLDETKNVLNKSDKSKILEFIYSINNNNLHSISYSQINAFYLYLYNLFMKKRFNSLPDSSITQRNNDFIINFLLFDNIFVDNLYKKKKCILRFALSNNKIKQLLIIQINSQELIFESKEEKNLVFDGTINLSLLENLYRIAQIFKKNFHTNLQIILEVLNYGKIELSHNLDKVTLRNVELGSISQDIQDLNEFYDRIEINLKRCLLFKIILTNKFKEKFELGYLRNFYHQEMEYQIDYNFQRNEINLGVISKLNTKRPDFNDIRKFFTGILQKIFMIMTKTSNICKSISLLKSGSDFKFFLKNCCPKSFFSPLSLDIRMINGDFRKYLSFQIHLDFKDKKMVKVINSATKSINFTSYNELIKSMYEDLGEKFVENIRNFNFYNVMIEKLFLRFSHTFLNPRLYEFMSNQENALFMIPKNYKTFHFISKNNVSFILEFSELNKIKIYSTNFIGYENNSRKLIDAMLNNSHSANTNGAINIILKKGVIFEIDPLNMENEIGTLIEMIEHFTLNCGNTCN